MKDLRFQDITHIQSLVASNKKVYISDMKLKEFVFSQILAGQPLRINHEPFTLRTSSGAALPALQKQIPTLPQSGMKYYGNLYPEF